MITTDGAERLAQRLMQESATATRLSSRERLVAAARMLRDLARERDRLAAVSSGRGLVQSAGGECCRADPRPLSQALRLRPDRVAATVKRQAHMAKYLHHF